MTDLDDQMALAVKMIADLQRKLIKKNPEMAAVIKKKKKPVSKRAPKKLTTRSAPKKDDVGGFEGETDYYKLPMFHTRATMERIRSKEKINRYIQRLKTFSTMKLKLDYARKSGEQPPNRSNEWYREYLSRQFQTKWYIDNDGKLPKDVDINNAQFENAMHETVEEHPDWESEDIDFSYYNLVALIDTDDNDFSGNKFNRIQLVIMAGAKGITFDDLYFKVKALKLYTSDPMKTIKRMFKSSIVTGLCDVTYNWEKINAELEKKKEKENVPVS